MPNPLGHIPSTLCPTVNRLCYTLPMDHDQPQHRAAGLCQHHHPVVSFPAISNVPSSPISLGGKSTVRVDDIVAPRTLCSSLCSARRPIQSSVFPHVSSKRWPCSFLASAVIPVGASKNRAMATSGFRQTIGAVHQIQSLTASYSRLNHRRLTH